MCNIARLNTNLTFVTIEKIVFFILVRFFFHEVNEIYPSGYKYNNIYSKTFIIN